MFESSPSYNANERTLAGFGSINPATGKLYTVPERSPYYDGTAQRDLGVKYGVPHGWTQRVDYMANQATGSYNALQVVLNKRYSSGLQVLTHYTWSHAIGHEAYEFLVNPRIGRGNGYYNRRQAFVLAGNYDLPFGRDKAIASGVPGWVNQIIGGFQLNSTVTIEGGVPFTTNYAQCSNDNDVGANDNACFLNRTGAGFGIHKGSYDPVGRFVPYLRPSPYVLQPPGQANNIFGGFARPAIATWGNIGRDALWGPGLWNVDTSVSKSFTLREGISLQFIAQAFNVFNHVNLANPDNCVDCQDLNSVGVQNAGTIQGTVSEQDGTSLRRLQFGARLQF